MPVVRQNFLICEERTPLACSTITRGADKGKYSQPFQVSARIHCKPAAAAAARPVKGQDESKVAISAETPKREIVFKAPGKITFETTRKIAFEAPGKIAFETTGEITFQAAREIPWARNCGFQAEREIQLEGEGKIKVAVLVEVPLQIPEAISKGTITRGVSCSRQGAPPISVTMKVYNPTVFCFVKTSSFFLFFFSGKKAWRRMAREMKERKWFSKGMSRRGGRSLLR